MQIDTNTPRTNITVQGNVLSAPKPFTEGHQLSANEAAALNQTFQENLRNNFVPRIESMKKAKAGQGATEDQIKAVQLSHEELQSAFDEYAQGYEFGVRIGGRTADPIEREMRNLAEAKVTAALKGKGITIVSAKKSGKFDELVDSYIGKNEDALRARAEARVREVTDMASEDLGL